MTASILALTALGTANVSAAPTEEEVEAAEAQVEATSHELENAIEDLNLARYELGEAQDQLAETERILAAAEREAETAREALESRAVEAYTGMGTQISSVLGAEDLNEFSDRLQFMGAIAQSDADLATTAEAAGQRAEWAREQREEALAAAEQHLAEVETARTELEGQLDAQEARAENLRADYEAFLAAQREALREAAENPVPPPPPTGGGGGGFAPPSNASGAQIAIAAAVSAIGSPYVSGAAGPDAFDCSGLTSWAWAQAGVSIPHSADAQYSSLPRVDLNAVQPGDIIYYGNYGPHVALYIGGGQIIHARNPSPDGVVQYGGLYSYDKPWGAVRPG